VRHARSDAAPRDRSAETALLALQGPASAQVLAALADGDVAALRRFTFVHCRVAGADALVSRTGYTGSDGFEIYLAAGDAEKVWDALLGAGGAAGVAPAGLGARDLLRLEAALPLYGHELDDTTSPLEARLDRFVKLDAGGFIGAEAIARRRAAGHTRLLTGFVLEQPGIARAGHAIAHGGAEVGVVTSGGPSPSLGKSIGLGYVPPALADAGSCFEVMIRGRAVRARAVRTPFFRDSSPRRVPAEA
jgi:aminomethyltransferase